MIPSAFSRARCFSAALAVIPTFPAELRHLICHPRQASRGFSPYFLKFSPYFLALSFKTGVNPTKSPTDNFMRVSVGYQGEIAYSFMDFNICNEPIDAVSHSIGSLSAYEFD